MKEPVFHIGLTIRQLAEEKNISVSVIADLLKITNQGVYDLFKRRVVKFDQIDKIAPLFEMNRQEILDRSEKGIVQDNKAIADINLNEYLKRMEETFEKRYEKIINHYETLLKRYEGQNVNFLNLAPSAKMIEMYPEQIQQEEEKEVA